MTCFIFHDWNKWEEFLEEWQRLPAAWQRHREVIKFTKRFQKRVCKACGYIQREELK